MRGFEFSINFWTHDLFFPEIFDECDILSKNMVFMFVVMVDMTHTVPPAEVTACCTEFCSTEVAAAMLWWMNLYGSSSASCLLP